MTNLPRAPGQPLETAANTGYPGAPHGAPAKAPTGGDGSAAHQVDGGVTAHRADNG